MSEQHSWKAKGGKNENEGGVHAGDDWEERLSFSCQSLKLSRQKANQYTRNHKDVNVSYIHMYAATARCPTVHDNALSPLCH